MAGQSNIFTKPETADPFGASTKDFATGIYDTEKRPNINDGLKKAAQAAWMKEINNPGNTPHS